MAAWWLAGIALGAINGISQMNQRNAEYQDKLDELNYQHDQLDLQYSQAQQSNALAAQQAQDQTAEANAEMNLLADQTIGNRDTAVKQTAQSGSMQSHLNALQMATLNVQNKQTEGAASQQVATSGFRNSGTAGNVLENAKRSSQMSTQQAQLQADMSNFQTYASALNTFTSANQQADAYRRQIEGNNNALDDQLEQLQLQMNQTTETYELQGGYIGSQIEYMEGEGRDALDQANGWGFFGSVLSGALSFV